MVERNLAKVDVVGSNPIIRSHPVKQCTYSGALLFLSPYEFPHFHITDFEPKPEKRVSSYMRILLTSISLVSLTGCTAFTSAPHNAPPLPAAAEPTSFSLPAHLW